MTKRIICSIALMSLVAVNAHADYMQVTKDKTLAVLTPTDYSLARDVVDSNDQEALISLIAEKRVVFLNKRDVLTVVGKEDEGSYIGLRKQGSTDVYYVPLNPDIVQFGKAEPEQTGASSS